jgi:pimeloyl-ACP methyl ester carboxylesterase
MFDSEEFNRRLFFPRADVSAPPAGAVDAMVPVPGASVHLRIHRSADARCSILLFHGNGEVVADYDEAAPAFARCGASLAVVDFRGYGASTGTPTLRSALADAPLVVRALLAQEQRPLIVMGRSVGSACAAELYGARMKELDGFILESGSSDLGALVRRRGLAVPREFEPGDRAVFDPLPKLQRGDQPLLVLHGADDQLIFAAEARRAFEVAGAGQKELVLIPGRGHNDVSFGAGYWDAIRTFVGTLFP